MSDHTDDKVASERERPAAFTGSGEGNKAPLVPKNVQRLATRTLFLLFGVAVIVLALQWWRSKGTSIDFLPADTTGHILAIQYLEEGARTVVIQPDGTLVESAGYREGATDRDAVWFPSGNRVLFVSDRKPGTTHIYQWNPAKNGNPDQMTVDESSRGEIAFPADVTEKADEAALVATRGNIEEFIPRENRSLRVLPPSVKDIAVGDEQGVQSAFQALYSRLGTSFRTARWCRGQSIVAAIMRRGEADGEILVIQPLIQDQKGNLLPPKAVMAGERIDIDVNPVTGDLAFACTGYDFINDQQRREATKNGKVQRPFINAVGMVDLSDPSIPRLVPMIASMSSDEAYGTPRVSPDGERILLTIGAWKESTLTPQVLVSAPIDPTKEKGRQLQVGEIFEPSWSPAGDRIVFVRRENGKRQIFVANADGSGATSITGDKGDFAHPLFSPQK